MTRILLIAPKHEKLVHDIPVHDNDSVRKIESFIKNKEEEYGELERIIINMGTVRIMERGDKIPIPLLWGGGGMPASKQ